MSRRQAGIGLIVVSIFFAIAIFISSNLLAGTNQADTAMFILIALWFVPFAYLSAKVSPSNSSE